MQVTDHKNAICNAVSCYNRCSRQFVRSGTETRRQSSRAALAQDKAYPHKIRIQDAHILMQEAEGYEVLLRAIQPSWPSWWATAYPALHLSVDVWRTLLVASSNYFIKLHYAVCSEVCTHSMRHLKSLRLPA